MSAEGKEGISGIWGCRRDAGWRGWGLQEWYMVCAGGDGEVWGCRGHVEVQEGMQAGQGCSRRCGVLGGGRQGCKVGAQLLTWRMREI